MSNGPYRRLLQKEGTCVKTFTRQSQRTSLLRDYRCSMETNEKTCTVRLSIKLNELKKIKIIIEKAAHIKLKIKINILA